MRRIQVVVVLAALLLTGAPMLATAATSPDFEIYVPENIVEPGEETSLELEIRNAASAEDDDSEVGEAPPTEARDVSVELAAEDAPIEVKTNESPLPTMSSQTLLSETFTIAVDEDAEAGVYELDAEIAYTYTRDGGNERTTSDTETIEVVVEERARFDAVGVESDLVVGDRGTVELDLNNTGVENASDAVVRFDSPDANVQAIDPTTDDSELQTAGSRAYVGDWAINETVTVEAAMEVDGDAVARTYPVSATVQFRDGEGVDRTSREVRVGAAAAPQQSFAFENVTTDLYVGEDGTVSGTIVNDGPKPVESAVVVVDDGEDDIVPDFDGGLGSGSNVYPRETQYAVGDLKPGESAPFEFRVGIGGEAEPGPRVMEADVRYRNVHDDVRTTTDPIDVPLDVAPERDEFDVEALNATQEVGETQRITLEVTNAKAEPVTDVEAKLYTNDPLDNHDDEGFIPALEPGESTTVTFEVEVADDATPQTYPLRMDFRYDDDSSNSQLTDTYRIPIEVVEPEGGISTVGALAAVGLVGVVAAVCWRFRERVVDAVAGVPVLGRIGDLELPGPIGGESGGGSSRTGTGTETGYGGHGPVDGTVGDDSGSAFGYAETDGEDAFADLGADVRRDAADADAEAATDPTEPSVDRGGLAEEPLEYDDGDDRDEPGEPPVDASTESDADH